MSREAVFTRIYRRNLWSDGESRSGSGSTLESTKAIRRQLPFLLRDLGAKSLLDIPCGDFNWMKEVDLTGIQYTGADIVEEIVACNQQRFGRSDRSFAKLDLERDQLPRVDLILCRDCLFHLSISDIAAALGKISASRSIYLLTTTYDHPGPNKDIVTGSWRRLNLQAQPFLFSAPLQIIDDDSDVSGLKKLALWRIRDLPAVTLESMGLAL